MLIVVGRVVTCWCLVLVDALLLFLLVVGSSLVARVGGSSLVVGLLLLFVASLVLVAKESCSN